MKIIVDNIICKCVIGALDTVKCNVYTELRAYLRVRPSNYHQMLSNMRRRGITGWDGYTYFINEKAEFATGFLPMVLKYLIELEVSVTIDDRRDNVIEFRPGEFDFITPQFILADHQQQLIIKSSNFITSLTKTHNWNVYFPRGIWKAATNAGKTAAAGALIKNLESPRVILLVHKQSLLMQHYEYYKTVFTGRNDIGTISSNKIEFGNILTIAMIRTLYRRMKSSMTIQRDLHSRFNVLIVDEVHNFSSREAVWVINRINAFIRIGMSGTPFDAHDNIARFRIVGMFGNVLHEVSKRELMDSGYSLSPKIFIYHNSGKPVSWNYDTEFEEMITESEKRAKLIADIIYEHRDKKILVTFFEKKHGELMYDTLCKQHQMLMHQANWVHGQHSDRNARVQAFKDNKITILFASTILQEGENIPDIEMGINAMAEKSAISVSQWCGRLERINGDAKDFTWVDFYDDGRWVSKHSRKRINLYKREGYKDPITFMYPNKNGIPI